MSCFYGRLPMPFFNASLLHTVAGAVRVLDDMIMCQHPVFQAPQH